MVSADLAKQRAEEAALNLTGRAAKYKVLRREAAKEAASQACSERITLDQSKSNMQVQQMLAPYNLVPCPDVPGAQNSEALLVKHH
mmetsp:Transcript_19625/g.34997  ORF Transcript_19625/g.34997 Transcript_19625/m.34997 type:complete len:86 (+) Transcript_19625:97-354(+)